MDILAIVSNICSILGFLLSIWLLFRTGKIEKSVNGALEHSKKMLNYSKHRKEYIDIISGSASYLMDEHTLNEQQPYIQKMDMALAELQACYPNLTGDFKSNIEFVRKVFDELETKPLSYISIFNRVNSILSILIYDNHWE